MMRILLLTCMTGLVAFPFLGAQETLAPGAVEAAIVEARKRLEAVREESKASRATRTRERLKLIEQIDQGRKARQRAEHETEDLHRRIEEAKEKSFRRRSSLEAERRNLQGLTATLKRGLKTLLNAEDNSLVVLEHPDILVAIRTLLQRLQGREEISLEEIRTILSTLKHYLLESRTSTRFNGEAVGPDGQIRRVEMVRLGQVACFFREGENTGHLVLGKEGRWSRLAADHAREIQALFSPDPTSSSVLVPLDPSGGLALRENGTGDSIFDRLEAGGPVLLAIGLLVLVALFLVGERLAFLARARKNLRKLETPTLKLAERDRTHDVRALINQNPGVLARVLSTVLTHPQEGDAAVDQALRQETPLLERSLGLLGVLGSVAPFLGLLGTVTGLITTFSTLTAVGSNDPRLLAGGISEALITTQAGLMVAIPILLTHAFLSSRVDDVADRIESVATALAASSRGKETP